MLSGFLHGKQARAAGFTAGGGPGLRPNSMTVHKNNKITFKI